VVLIIDSAIIIDVSPDDPRSGDFNSIYNLVGFFTGNPWANTKIFK
jgi:hypothetical protein